MPHRMHPTDSVRCTKRALWLLGLAALLCLPAPPWPAAAAAESPPQRRADPAYEIRFPEDEGSHPAFGGEWWYITGWLEAAGGQPLGFQVTFFRFRAPEGNGNPSRFAPQQVFIAHAALSDPRRGTALHDQRIARDGFGLADAREGVTDVWIDDWSLKRDGSGYRAVIPGRGLALDLRFEPTQPPLLQGERGFTRKGPDPASASHYYSLPQLRVTGTVAQEGREDRPEAVTGTAWLDHEWFGNVTRTGWPAWDWVGINLADGGALMAIRMRDGEDRPSWALGSHRDAAGTVTVFGPGDIAFTPLRTWRSGRTGTVYPVEWRIRAGEIEVTVQPLMDDQEFDARLSAGTIYWEGAVRVHRGGDLAGLGYLELTGYWRRPPPS